MIIEIGRYDYTKIDLSPAEYQVNKKRRIFSKSPNQMKTKSYTPIATDGLYILCESGHFPIRDFFAEDRYWFGNSLLVLTRSEEQLLLKEMALFNRTIDVFEKRFPFFTDIRFSTNPRKNYERLIKKLKEAKSLGLSASSAAEQIVSAARHRVARSIRFKSSLDSWFGLASSHSFQEVFRFREERPNRVVMAFDVNSMFPSLLANPFPDPKSLQYRRIDSPYKDSKPLEEGLYRVVLSSPKSTFIRNYHPIIHIILGRGYRFYLNPTDSVEIHLMKSELDYLAPFFNHAMLIDSITSSKSIQHPLLRQSQKLYAQRKSARKNGEIEKEAFLKQHLAMLHSCTGPASSIITTYKSEQELRSFLKEKYFIDCRSQYNLRDIGDELKRSSGFSLGWTDSDLFLRSPNFDDHRATRCLSAQVHALARVRMLQIIRHFFYQPSVEICYVNVDSIHLSIAKNQVNTVLENSRHLLSNDLGKLKVQAVADRGYWFDVGRYWLFRDGKTVKSSNKILNNAASNNQFISWNRIGRLVKTGSTQHPEFRTFTIGNTLNFDKRLDSSVGAECQDFERYAFPEIQNLAAARETITQETYRSKLTKLDAFNELAAQ